MTKIRGKEAIVSAKVEYDDGSTELTQVTFDGNHIQTGDIGDSLEERAKEEIRANRANGTKRVKRIFVINVEHVIDKK